MYKFLKSKELLFWRLYASGTVVFFARNYLGTDIKYYLALLLILFILNVVLINDSKMQTVVDFIYSNKFESYLKCLMTAIVISVSGVFAIVIFVFKAAPDTPVSIIGASIFFGYFGLVFLARHFKIKSILLCTKQKDTSHE